MVLTVLTLLCALSSGAAQQDVPPAALAQRAHAALDGLARDLPAGPEQQLHIRWLRDAIPRAGALPEIAVTTLEGLHQAVETSKALSEDQKARVLEAVAEDLRLKATYCRIHPDGMGARIPLTVRTLRGGDEVKNWEVFYLSAPLAILPGRTGEPFPQTSSPTTQPLPPGRYVIWAQDPLDKSRRGPERPVTLGSPDGVLDAPVTADVFVPQK